MQFFLMKYYHSKRMDWDAIILDFKAKFSQRARRGMLLLFLMGFFVVVYSVVNCYSEQCPPKFNKLAYLHLARTDLWKNSNCFNLLSTGKLVDGEWEPDGCSMIHYDTGNSRECFRRISKIYGIAHVAFIGDSRVRTLVRNLIRIVNASSPLTEHVQNQTHINYRDNEIKLRLELKWTPVVNQDMFDALKDWYKSPVHFRPLILVAGAGLWMVKYDGVGEHSFNKFKRNTLRMKEKLVKLTNETVVLWTMSDPVIYHKLKNHQKNLTQENINWYNNMTKDAMSGSGIYIWESARMVSFAYGVSDYTDGLHVSGKTLEKDLQILLNYYCNPFMSNEKEVCCGHNLQ